MMKCKDYPYERAGIEEAEGKLRKLARRIEEAESGEEQLQAHREYYALTDQVETMAALAEIRHDGDTADEYYNGEQDYYDSVLPRIQSLETAYKKCLYESRFRPRLEEEIGKVAFTNIGLALKSVDERIVPLMQEENALSTEYDKLIAGAKIPFDGKELNLSLLRPYMTHQDRQVRREAWGKYEEFFRENGERLDGIFDRLVKNRTKQARELGFENYLGLGYCRMNRNCYDAGMVADYRQQVKKYFVPLAERLHERRRERLGLERLSCADEDVFFKEGNPRPSGTPDEILRAGQRMYRELSPETGEFIDFMMERELFDVLGRKNKKAGGYTTYLPNYKAPFVFANFNASSGDVDVMTHECGHAFQAYLAAGDPVKEHSEITMETAEIHSMSMEFFAERWMELFFGERAGDYRLMHLEDAVMFIPYGCMVDEFQHIVYENPDLAPEERHAAWRRLEREYKPHLDYEGYGYFAKGGFWQKQLHIYDYPLYYIDYCLAQTCALQYKLWMDRDFSGAWESYLKLCRLSAADYFTGLLGQVGLENPFEEGCVKRLAESLERRIEKFA